MATPSLKRVPDFSECPTTIDPAIADDLRSTWQRLHGPELDLRVSSGAGAASVIVVVGTRQRAQEIFVFARGPGSGLDGPLATAIDVADRLLAQAGQELRGFLPLDWQGQAVDSGVVFVRGEVRNYDAEDQAAALLDEEPPLRALAGFPPADQ